MADQETIDRCIANLSKHIRRKVDGLSRERCVEVLTEVGIQCYDHETVNELREAVYVNCCDGTIDYGEI